MPNEQTTSQNPAPAETVAPKDDYQLASSENSVAQETTEPVEVIEPENPSTESETEEIEASAEETEAEREAELAAGERTDEPGKKKGGVQKRIDKLTKRNSNLARENEYLKEQLFSKGKPSSQGEQTQTVTDKREATTTVETAQKPNRENFETLEAYTEALTDWKVDQKLALKEERSTKQKAEDSAKADAAKLKTDHLDRVAKYQKETPEFVEAMEDFKTAKIALNVQFAVMESEFGPQLMHEFANQPEVLERLNELSPQAMNREIGRMEAKFASKQATPNETTTPAAPAKKITKAPAPITPVNSKAGHVKTSRDNLPYDEWVKVRRSEMKDR